MKVIHRTIEKNNKIEILNKKLINIENNVEKLNKENKNFNNTLASVLFKEV